MKNEIVARRYGDAFIGYVNQTIGTDKGIAELQAIKGLLEGSDDFSAFLSDPDISEKEKAELIDNVFSGTFSEESRHFLRLLLDKGRIGIFPDVAEYVRATYGYGARQEAVMRTGRSVDQDMIDRIKSALEKKVGREVRLVTERDGALLGGIYIKIGNVVIDGTVRRQLDDLKETLHVLKVT